MIRKIDLQDIDHLVRIFSNTVPEHWTREGILAELDNPDAIMLGYFSEDKLIGFILGTHSFEEGYISNIGVDANYRNQGVGKMLLDEIIKEFVKQGAEYAVLEVRKSNVVAQGFYKSAGFVNIGERKGIYSQPKEDGIIMKKELVL